MKLRENMKKILENFSIEIETPCMKKNFWGNFGNILVGISFNSQGRLKKQTGDWMENVTNLRKFLRNFNQFFFGILQNFWINREKNIETILRKFETTFKKFWNNFRKILRNFTKSLEKKKRFLHFFDKFWKNCRKIWQKFRKFLKYFRMISYEFCEYFDEFLCKFEENFNEFRENFWINFGKIMEQLWQNVNKFIMRRQ